MQEQTALRLIIQRSSLQRGLIIQEKGGDKYEQQQLTELPDNQQHGKIRRTPWPQNMKKHLQQNKKSVVFWPEQEQQTVRKMPINIARELLLFNADDPFAFRLQAIGFNRIAHLKFAINGMRH